MKVIIIIPTLNEEKSLNILIKKLRFLIKKKKLFYLLMIIQQTKLDQK